jgi:hypothetical protein
MRSSDLIFGITVFPFIFTKKYSSLLIIHKISEEIFTVLIGFTSDSSNHLFPICREEYTGIVVNSGIGLS